MSSAPDLAEILSKINDGICVLGSDGRISFVNEKASQILQSSDDAFQRNLQAAAQGGCVARFEHFHSVLNRWYEHHAYPNADGGLTLVSCDITSRHRMEAALRASEERFRRVIESNIIGVIVVENGVITEANDIFLGMVNYARADMTRGQLRWRYITPPEFRDLDARAQIELEAKGVFAPYEKEFFRKDGGRIPVLIGGVSTEDQAGARETLCLALDLSERKRAEGRVYCMLEIGKILAASLEYQHTFPEIAEFIVSRLADSCGIYVLEEGQLIRAAAAHSAPLPAELPPPPDLRRAIALKAPEITTSPFSRILVPITIGAEAAGLLSIASMKPAAFGPEDVHFFEFVARRAGLVLENARLYHEAQKANRLKDEFVAVISHELRTPLTPILGGVYMIRSEPNDPSVFVRALDLIERNAKAQVKIVDDLLDVSRALSGKLRLNLDMVDLVQVLHAAVETVRPASEAKGIQIHLHIAAASLCIAGDPDRLEQVFWNLLSNSVKFTPANGQITIELAECSGYAEVCVSDTGIGIDADFLPHVFDKFSQADASRTRPHGGLGLGLAIVRHIVESHGGTVQALSSGGEQGSTFVVRLPLKSTTRTATV